MSRERADHALQPTALVNEVYLRLVDMRQVQWTDRAHFLALAARVMRGILVDLARSQLTQKRGAGAVSISLDEESLMAPGRGRENLVALDDALQALAALDPRRSQVVELAFSRGWTRTRLPRSSMCRAAPSCATGRWRARGCSGSFARRAASPSRFYNNSVSTWCPWT